MKSKPTIKEIIKANLKYAISVLCSIFAMAISFIWKWRVNTFIDVIGLVVICLVILVALILSIE